MNGSNIKLLIAPLRMLLYIGSGFVFIAGIQLFFLAEQTEFFFAWTIQPPLTAAVLGAFYFGTMAFGFLSARELIWAYARGAVPAVIFFTSLTFAATWLHLDRFHLNSPNPLTLAATYMWLAIYALEPPVLIILLYLQSRASGGDPARTALLPNGFRAILVAQGIVFLGLAVGLFLAPPVLIPLWPWGLTPLTARAIAAWLFSLGVIDLQAAWENDWARIRIAMMSYAIFGALELIALGIYARDLNWSAPGAGVLIALLLSVLGMGAYGWRNAGAAKKVIKKIA